MITSKIIISDTEVKVEHEESTDPSWCREKELFIESNSSENNTLSTITINNDLKIYIFWESLISAESFEVLYIPETYLLYVGCGTLSARISVKKRKLIDLNYICLFWGLERHKEYVLETGELECFLYNFEGEIISSASVDPPYEVEMAKDGIRFKSIVMGITWLKYK